MLQEMGIAPRAGVRIETDQNTAHGRTAGFISDRSFFNLFADAEVLAVDHSSYENADILCNLCEPIPAELTGRFNFVYNGSVLDNVFDPAAAMRNITELVGPGGVIFHYEGVVHWAAAYTRFMPDWFFDYYAINKFQDFRAFLCTHKDIYNSPWEMYEWWPFQIDNATSASLTQVPEPSTGRECVVVVVAEKGPNSTSNRIPIQSAYRQGHAEYFEAFLRFRNSGRSYPFPKRNETGFHYAGTVV